MALSFLFAMVMDRLTDEVRQESLWMIMFADDIMICSESRKQVYEDLEMWKYVLKRRGIKENNSYIENMFTNEKKKNGEVSGSGGENGP